MKLSLILLFFLAVNTYAAEWFCDSERASFINGIFILQNNKSANGVCEKKDGGMTEVTAEIKNGKPDGILTAFDSRGRKTHEIEYKNGLKTGNIKVYYDNGQLKSEQTPEYGKIFYRSGQIYLESKLENGVFEGKVKEYYEGGNIRSETDYVLGRKNGLSVYFFENGKTAYEFSFSDDKYSGLSKAYLESGRQVFEIIYNNDKPVSGYCFGNEKITLKESELGNWQDIVCWSDEAGLLSMESVTSIK